MKKLTFSEFDSKRQEYFDEIQDLGGMINAYYDGCEDPDWGTQEEVEAKCAAIEEKATELCEAANITYDCAQSVMDAMDIASREAFFKEAQKQKGKGYLSIQFNGNMTVNYKLNKKVTSLAG